MISISFNTNDRPVINSDIKTTIKQPVDIKLKDIFNRHFNEHDYKQNKLKIFKRICEDNNLQLITDYDYEENKFIDKTKNRFMFVIFDYKKLFDLFTSVQNSRRAENMSFEFYIILDITDIFKALNLLLASVKKIMFTPYELFNGKIMMFVNIALNKKDERGYIINKQFLSSLMMYNYMFNRVYELVKILNNKYESKKVFDNIDSDESDEAKELKALINSFYNH